MKAKDLIVTKTNGFTGEVRVCEIVEIKYEDCATVRYGDGNFDTVFVELRACTPAPKGAKVGDLIRTERPITLSAALGRW